MGNVITCPKHKFSTVNVVTFHVAVVGFTFFFLSTVVNLCFFFGIEWLNLK